MNLFCPTRRPKQLSYSRLFAAPLILLLVSFEGAGVIQAQHDFEDVAKKVSAREGEATLIVGHSNTVPEMIKALGGDVAPIIDEKEYDDLFILTIYAKGKAKVTQLKYGKQP